MNALGEGRIPAVRRFFKLRAENVHEGGVVRLAWLFRIRLLQRKRIRQRESGLLLRLNGSDAAVARWDGTYADRRHHANFVFVALY